VRFPVPELFLGCFLTVAVFAAGMLFVRPYANRSAYQISAASAQSESKEKQSEGDPSGGWAWLSKDAAGFFTFGLVVIGIGQALLFFIQLRYMRQGMTDAATAANAAKDGAHAARDSADVSKLAMIAGERAYVHYSGCRWISHISRIDGSVFWRIRPLWINAGNTPARKMRVYVHYELLDHVLPPDYPFRPDEVPIHEGMIAAKGLIESSPRDIFGHELRDVIDGKKFLYIWGVIRYSDVFPGTPERITKFCVFATNITGDPMVEWNEATNKFDMAFLGYDRNNCIDEDC
jgi:hypothetical protein